MIPSPHQPAEPSTGPTSLRILLLLAVSAAASSAVSSVHSASALLSSPLPAFRRATALPWRGGRGTPAATAIAAWGRDGAGDGGGDEEKDPDWRDVRAQLIRQFREEEGGGGVPVGRGEERIARGGGRSCPPPSWGSATRAARPPPGHTTPETSSRWDR